MCSLGYALIDDNDNVISKIEKKKSSSRSKTLKRQNNSNVTQMINEMNKIHSDENSDENSDETSDNGMTDFTPPSKPESAAIERKDAPQVNTQSNDEDNDGALNTPEAFNNITSEQANDYYRANVPYYTQMSQAPLSNKDELMKKMEKILYLLEEQQDEKTGHVTEELILYSFLGVFIIFVVDSFARAGKYVR